MLNRIHPRVVGLALWVTIPLLISSGAPTSALGGEPLAARARIPITSEPIRPRAGLNFWIAQTTQCPQVMGSDPWPCLELHALDGNGDRQPGNWQALVEGAASGRPVIVILHGNRYTTRDAADVAFTLANALDGQGILPPDAIVVSFHWPSQRVYYREIRDLNEKGRRAMIAGYHLARFLSAFPPESRISLVGHSHGGKSIVAALHLLGGGQASSLDDDPAVGLPFQPPPLRIRAVLIACASDHDWLIPGERMGSALSASEALLNLYNRGDLALWLYPFGRRSDGGKALGRVGLSPRDLDRLGPLAHRVEQYNLRPVLRHSHVFTEAFTHPDVAARVAPYLWVPDHQPIANRALDWGRKRPRIPSILRRSAP